jgi:hypothetical protein
MASDASHPAVLVLGEHPCTYLAAAMLRDRPPLSVVHATVPTSPPAPADRLVLVNPAFFQLHPLLAPLARKLPLTRIYGLRFLGEQADTAGQYRAKSTLGLIARFGDLRDATARIAADAGVVLHQPASLHIAQVDQTGLDVVLDQQNVRAQALILGSVLPDADARILQLDRTWDPQIMHRCFLAPLVGDAGVELGPRPLVPMSLDLQQMLHWGWLLQHGGVAQISVIQPLAHRAPARPRTPLEDWLQILRRHRVVGDGARLDGARICSFDLALAGALEHEGVANRTLLIGPAGGFYSASAQDMYPNCWSAVFAVDVMRRALRETHLQDALDVYRHKWRTTLGEYLLGPQQNLRFLLPLIYRNQNLTTRIAESILLGKSVVR